MADWTELNRLRCTGPQYGRYSSTPEFGFAGMFVGLVGAELVRMVASDGMGWQHVSVSLVDNAKRAPKWATMCAVKDLFWEPADVVVQFHPRASEYVNFHPGCLHLWRVTDGREFPTPDAIMVGPTRRG